MHVSRTILDNVQTQYEQILEKCCEMHALHIILNMRHSKGHRLTAAQKRGVLTGEMSAWNLI